MNHFLFLSMKSLAISNGMLNSMELKKYDSLIAWIINGVYIDCDSSIHKKVKIKVMITFRAYQNGMITMIIAFSWTW